jgi:hypothetical protein
MKVEDSVMVVSGENNAVRRAKRGDGGTRKEAETVNSKTGKEQDRTNGIEGVSTPAVVEQEVGEVEFAGGQLDESAVVTLCEGHATTLCRINGRYFLHTKSGFSSSVKGIRLTESRWKPVSVGEARLLIAVFGSRRGMEFRKVATIDRRNGVGR